MAEALAVLTREGIDAYLEAGRVIGKLGRGVEPMLAFLEEWPSTAKAVGEIRAAGGDGADPAHAEIAQRPRHRALPADAGAGGAPPAIAGTAAALPRHHARFHGAHHRLHPRPPHHLPQPRPAGLLRAGAEPAQPADAGRPEELGRIRHPQLRHPPRAAEGLLQPAIGRQPRRAAARAPRHPAGRRRAQARSVPARPVAGQRPAGAVLHRVRRTAQADSLLRQARHPPAGRVRRRTAKSAASTATAPCSPTSSATAAGPRRRSPTTGARSSAWRWSSSRTAASRRC